MIRLADEIGRAKAKELIMTCERISAREALRIGLVNQVAPLSSFSVHCIPLVLVCVPLPHP